MTSLSQIIPLSYAHPAGTCIVSTTPQFHTTRAKLVRSMKPGSRFLRLLRYTLSQIKTCPMKKPTRDLFKKPASAAQMQCVAGISRKTKAVIKLRAGNAGSSFAGSVGRHSTLSIGRATSSTGKGASTGAECVVSSFRMMLARRSRAE